MSTRTQLGTQLTQQLTQWGSIILPVLLLSFCPDSGAAPRELPKLGEISLNVSKLKNLISGFGANIERAPEPEDEDDDQGHSKAEIFGSTFSACVPKLKVIKHTDSLKDSADCSNAVGFEFLDTGKGDASFVSCVEKMKKSGNTCEDTPCDSLSSLYNFDLPHEGNNLEVKVISTNRAMDIKSRQRYSCENFPKKFSQADLVHKPEKRVREDEKAQREADQANKKREKEEQLASQELERETLINEEKAEKSLKHNEKIQALKDQICVDCKTKESLQAAIDANDRLLTMREFADELGKRVMEKGEFEKNKKRFDEAGLKILLAEIASAPLEQLGDLRDRLLKWAKDHPKDAEEVVKSGLKPLGERFIHNTHATPETFEAASEIFEQARKLTTNSKAKTEFAKALENLKIQRIVSMAQFGLQRNKYNFVGEYTHLLRETEQRAWNVCYGFHANIEECAEVLKLRTVVKSLPQIAQAADIQGTQAQVGLQQTLHPEHYGLPSGMTPAIPGIQPINPALPGIHNPHNPLLPVNPAMAMNPAMNSMYSVHPGGVHMGGMYPGMSPGMNPLAGVYPHPGMNPMNPLTGGVYPGMGVPQMGGMNNMNMMGGYNPMNPMMNSMNQMNPMMGGYNPMNPMMNGVNPLNPMMSSYNQMNPMMGGYNQMNPMMGGYNQMNPMMGGYNQMNPMMGGMNPTNPIPVPH